MDIRRNDDFSKTGVELNSPRMCVCVQRFCSVFLRNSAGKCVLLATRVIFRLERLGQNCARADGAGVRGGRG